MLPLLLGLGSSRKGEGRPVPSGLAVQVASHAALVLCECMPSSAAPCIPDKGKPLYPPCWLHVQLRLDLRQAQTLEQCLGFMC